MSLPASKPHPLPLTASAGRWHGGALRSSAVGLQLHQLTATPLLLPAVMGSYSHAVQFRGWAAVSTASCCFLLRDVGHPRVGLTIRCGPGFLKDEQRQRCW